MTNDLDHITRTIRRDILTMSFSAKSAHVGGALSVVEILVTLYFRILRVDPKKPTDPARDRVIFSKAHDAKALFATLCRRGYFDEEILKGYEKDNGLLPGHSTRFCVPGVEASAGSLGHGLPIATGVALAGKLSKHPFRVFAVLSDGECDEGSTWEAALFAGHHKLENLTAIIDYNKLQGFGYTKDVLDLEPFADKWRAFNWSAVTVSDGHSIPEIEAACSRLPHTKGKPTVIIAHTTKGKGGVVKHINQVSSQYKPPTEEELRELFAEKQP